MGKGDDFNRASSGSQNFDRLVDQKASAMLITSKAGLRVASSCCRRWANTSVGKVTVSTLIPDCASNLRSSSPSPVAAKMAGWVTQVIVLV